MTTHVLLGAAWFYSLGSVNVNENVDLELSYKLLTAD